MSSASVRDRIVRNEPYFTRLLEMGVQGYALGQILTDGIIIGSGNSSYMVGEDGEWILEKYRGNEIPPDLFPAFWAAAMAALLIPDPGIEHYPGSSWTDVYAGRREEARKHLAHSMQGEPAL